MSYQKSSIQILKLKNQTYLPFQLHQLPKWFNTSTTNYFNYKGYCYISLTDILKNNKFFNLQNFKDKLTFNNQLPQQYKTAK
tara:strand:- start:524 stop:769 length:246 start_codon:yes stop_codon:yes gene_type:complete